MITLMPLRFQQRFRLFMSNMAAAPPRESNKIFLQQRQQRSFYRLQLHNFINKFTREWGTIDSLWRSTNENRATFSSITTKARFTLARQRRAVAVSDVTPSLYQNSKSSRVVSLVPAGVGNWRANIAPSRQWWVPFIFDGTTAVTFVTLLWCR